MNDPYLPGSTSSYGLYHPRTQLIPGEEVTHFRFPDITTRNGASTATWMDGYGPRINRRMHRLSDQDDCLPSQPLPGRVLHQYLEGRHGPIGGLGWHRERRPRGRGRGSLGPRRHGSSSTSRSTEPSTPNRSPRSNNCLLGMDEDQAVRRQERGSANGIRSRRADDLRNNLIRQARDRQGRREQRRPDSQRPVRHYRDQGTSTEGSDAEEAVGIQPPEVNPPAVPPEVNPPAAGAAAGAAVEPRSCHGAAGAAADGAGTARDHSPTAEGNQRAGAGDQEEERVTEQHEGDRGDRQPEGGRGIHSRRASAHDCEGAPRDDLTPPGLSLEELDQLEVDRFEENLLDYNKYRVDHNDSAFDDL